jgi:CspA family cold shock protein
MEGTIRKIIRERGFGFIHAQNGQDVFFHRKSLRQLDFERLTEGLNVEFELEHGQKGPRAANVRLSWTEVKRLG